ncbi:MAG: gliding motility-associated C-terminal domain-containing protein [Elusimicrobia bacterium]|nr:gliding motility-associated C-terminal domain-containing protein [Elusimicrobiota bacterium]
MSDRLYKSAKGLVLAGAMLLSWARAPFAFAANPSYLNLNVGIQGIVSVTDLTAQTGATDGSVNLTWTEPGRVGITLPASYDIRVSSIGQISNNGQFNAAQPLSVFSPSVIPAPGPGGGAAGFVVNGLVPSVTYFFAIREKDSTATPFIGTWLRSVPQNWNVSNFAPAKFTPGVPSAITDLAAAPTLNIGEIKLTWTAPPNLNGVPVSSYTLKFNATSIADLAGDTSAWFNLATSTVVIVVPAHSSGTLETVLLSGLPTNTVFYFGIKSTDIVGETSSLDTKALGVATQVKAAAVGIISLFASTGAVSGSVDLSWTEPLSAALTPPLSYVIHVSSVANIADNAAFLAAQPLTAFSQSAPPVPGAGGANITFTVTGLTPFTTYFFAIAERDSAVPTPFQTTWLRNPSLGLSTTNFAQAKFLPGAPAAITDLTALPGAGEGDVTLSWTSPATPNFVPLASYTVRFATFSAASLAGNTTAWFNAASSSVVVAPALPSGSLVSVNIGGLYPLSTFFFAVKANDIVGEVSDIDALTAGGLQPFTLPGNLPPATPTGLTAVAGITRVTLTWSDLTAAQKGLDAAFFRLYRSTQAATNFVAITTTTALTFLDKPLVAFTTYFYKISAAEGPGGLESVLSSTASAMPFTTAPMEPFGLVVNPSSSSIYFSWTPTVQFADGTPFVSSAAPTVDELIGYRVLRSTGGCGSSFISLSTMSFAKTTATDTTNGNAYFYQIESFNILGPSTSTLLVSSLGDRNFFLDDCVTNLVIPNAQASTLNKSSNSIGDIMIERRRRPEDIGDTVLTSVEFKPMLNGTRELKGFYLPSPARIALHFQTIGGNPVPGSLSAQSLAPRAAASISNLGVFWNNGAQFQRMFGTVNGLDQTVNVASPNLGIYQVRTQLRSEGPVFDVSNISARVFTPNGDGLNDVIIFTYDPGPNNTVPTGTIFDTRGRFVANMTFGLVPNTLVWDGKSAGKTVTSGVYLYQIQGDGKTFNGSIVVAR